MPAIGAAGTAVSSMGLGDPVTIVVTMCSVICMVSVISMCTCCHKKVKNRDLDDVYGIVNPTEVSITAGEAPCPNSVINFRSQSKSTKISERHSQPSGKNGNSFHGSSIRASAPGRALPTLPPQNNEVYSAIEKNRKEIRFADDGLNPTYESIDPDADSFVDPLYSKVTAPRRPDRKYDYPVFSGRTQTDSARNDTGNDDVLYQSASQVYAGGSEDPYSSITSDARGTTGDFDNNSMCDPGYAKVKPTSSIDAKRLERMEKTERELDQLYSKIRRSSRDASDSPVAGPGRVTMDELMGAEPLDSLMDIPPAQVDSNSVSSREPSYRYITVRENADAVRERLRQQGQLQQPIREHYYSVIGNDYETVGDTNSSTYSHVNGVQPSVAATPSRITNFSELHVSTTSRSDKPPPPPTSPIPDRIGVDAQSSSHASSHAHIHAGVNSSPDRTVTDTYAVVSKPNRGAIPIHGVGTESQKVTTFGAEPLQTSPKAGVHSPPLHWNSASLGTATSFAGLQRQHSNSSNSPNRATSNPPMSQSLMGIQEFMQRPTLPYVNAHGATVIGMRSTEERETIVENRMSNPNGSLSNDLNGMARIHNTDTSPLNTSSERVHNVEIKRIGPTVSSALGANDIISARRYRSSSQSGHQLQSSGDQSGSSLSTPVHDRQTTEFGVTAGPSSPVTSYGSESLDTARSLTSARSSLPLPLNSEETRRLSDKSRMRRQESLEREQRSTSGRDSSTKDRSRERRKPWKEESEDSKVKRLGTIYTANDYVSTIDMGTRRPWPMTGPSSPPSLRKSRTSDDEDFKRATSPFSQVPLSIHTPNLFSWDLSETSSMNSAKLCADGDCDDANCFCHSKSSRSKISEGNLAEMRKISWNEPID